jgi:hypothetical protein
MPPNWGFVRSQGNRHPLTHGCWLRPPAAASDPTGRPAKASVEGVWFGWRHQVLSGGSFAPVRPP